MSRDFNVDLQASRDAEPRFDQLYRRIWPRCTIQRRSDLPIQYAGVDVVVEVDPSSADPLQGVGRVLGTRLLLIDEKWRPKNYPDCLVELAHIHDDNRETPGWAVSEKKITTVIAYGMPSQCRLIEYSHLRMAARRYGSDPWLSLYPQPGEKPRTNDYVMRNCCVPWTVIQAHTVVRRFEW